jgi:hypothetical protein
MDCLELEHKGVKEFSFSYSGKVRKLDVYDIVAKDSHGNVIHRIKDATKIDLYELADEIIDIRGY